MSGKTKDKDDGGLAAALRHECAASGLHEHDGCTCSDGELIGRAFGGMEETDPSLSGLKVAPRGQASAASLYLDRFFARVARMEEALKALDAATVSAIHENGEPNRVLFKDGFVAEGRIADEWLRFMRLIQSTCRAALRGDDVLELRADGQDDGARAAPENEETKR